MLHFYFIYDLRRYICLVLFFISFSLKSMTPGVPVYDTSGNNYIEYIPGNLPIIISAPHGGVLLSGETIGEIFYSDNDADLPDRTCGINERDDNTEILIREIQKEIFTQTGCYAHIIINRLHRSKLDPNRASVEATCNDTDAKFYWDAFHDFIDTASTDVETNWGKGLYIDLHGQSHSIPRVELGYNISSSELNNSNLNSSSIINNSSIKNLVATNLTNISHEDLIRGNNSFGAKLKNITASFYNNNVNANCGSNVGYRALPSNYVFETSSSCNDTRPFNNAYFDGDFYNNLRHGSANITVDDGNGGTTGGAGTIDGIMIEVNRRVRDLGTYDGRFFDNRPQTLVPFAKDFASVTLDYMNTHYNDFTSFNYNANEYTISDANPIPNIEGISGGEFSSSAGLAINISTGEIDLENSDTGSYRITYSINNCSFFDSFQDIELIDTTLNTANNELEKLLFINNPIKNELTIYTRLKSITKIHIHNLQGKIIKTISFNNDKTVYLNDLSPNIYMISFSDVNNQILALKKIIKI
ncbi:T9SS type A sorting domain-containing protein [Aquimarina agarilytica]|uniref:T9SS type A sorting domain-containing protein n=1 Tax=Aquimarina agarilytica TaxID=1087449 RepID=UPI0012FA5D4A|nr:T9SS type A sorting domain-containing protein [Aquimarina agarilytica]